MAAATSGSTAASGRSMLDFMSVAVGEGAVGVGVEQLVVGRALHPTELVQPAVVEGRLVDRLGLVVQPGVDISDPAGHRGVEVADRLGGLDLTASGSGGD